MSNQIQPFDFNGIQVRVLTDEHGNPWFLGADVCAILGTATNHIREYLDADEITNIRSTDIAQNGGKAPVFVSESGLYSLVLRSRKPEAREFKRWVTHEVLPSIRRHGAYMTESTLGDDMRPCAHATVMPPPDGSVEKAVGAGVEAFQKAFNESMESRGM